MRCGGKNGDSEEVTHEHVHGPTLLTQILPRSLDADSVVLNWDISLSTCGI